MRPVVLSIAGSDPCGGSGLQADLKTLEAWGCHAATAVAAITVQDTRGVTRVEPLAPELVVAQIEAVLDDLPVAVVKTGMLANGPIVRAVAGVLARRAGLRLVCDPVLRASGGGELLDGGGRAALLERLAPLAALLTPNAEEAAALTGLPVGDADEAERAARRLLDHGAAAVLVKGGHLLRGIGTDVLVTRERRQDFLAEDGALPATRGTGCMFASCVAARLAHGDGLAEAVLRAKRFVAAAARSAERLGRGAALALPRAALAALTPAGATGEHR